MMKRSEKRKSEFCARKIKEIRNYNICSWVVFIILLFPLTVFFVSRSILPDWYIQYFGYSLLLFYLMMILLQNERDSERRHLELMSNIRQSPLNLPIESYAPETREVKIYKILLGLFSMIMLFPFTIILIVFFSLSDWYIFHLVYLGLFVCLLIILMHNAWKSVERHLQLKKMLKLLLYIQEANPEGNESGEENLAQR